MDKYINIINESFNKIVNEGYSFEYGTAKKIANKIQDMLISRLEDLGFSKDAILKKEMKKDPKFLRVAIYFDPNQIAVDKEALEVIDNIDPSTPRLFSSTYEWYGKQYDDSKVELQNFAKNIVRKIDTRYYVLARFYAPDNAVLYTIILNERQSGKSGNDSSSFKTFKNDFLNDIEEGIDPFDEFTEAAEYFNDLAQEVESEEGWFSEPSGQGLYWTMYIYNEEEDEIEIDGNEFDDALADIIQASSNKNTFKNKYRKYIESCFSKE